MASSVTGGAAHALHPPRGEVRMLDAIDRMPRLQTTAAHRRGELVNRQIAALRHAYDVGIDPPEVTNWVWPL